MLPSATVRIRSVKLACLAPVFVRRPPPRVVSQFDAADCSCSRANSRPRECATRGQRRGLRLLALCLASCAPREIVVHVHSERVLEVPNPLGERFSLG